LSSIAVGVGAPLASAIRVSISRYISPVSRRIERIAAFDSMVEASIPIGSPLTRSRSPRRPSTQAKAPSTQAKAPQHPGEDRVMDLE
jgi:hypothetical protein